MHRPRGYRVHASIVIAASLQLAACSSETSDDWAGPPKADAASDWSSPPPDAAFDDADAAAGHDASDGAAVDSGMDVGGDVAPDSSLDAPDEPDSPPWIVGGVALCPEAVSLCDSGTDASAVLQTCIDRTPDGMALELAPCRYSLAIQLRLDHPITLRTQGKVGAPPCSVDAGHGCAELFALPAFDERFGLFKATAAVTVDHLVLDGNRQNRGGTHAGTMCSTLADNAYGFNGSFFCSGCTLQDSVSKYALCGTGFLAAPGSALTFTRNTFAYNGLHTTQNMWADGLTVHDADSSTFTSNAFIDNTDIDLIFGGCRHCVITGNTVKHTADPAGGSFAAIMIQKWPTTSGSYEGVDVSGNDVDCGPLRNCGSGLYIGSEGWYPETPYGTLVEGTTSGLITKNAVVNAMNALYIAAQGLAIYGNDFLNAHGVNIPNSCHTTIVSQTPIVVSPTTKSCHFNLENVDPVMSKHYSSASWAGCVPNYPF